MKTIVLTRGCVALVDDEDYERLRKHKWRAQVDPDGARIYAVREIWGSPRKNVLMHREILGVPAGVSVDHREHHAGELLVDNRRSNLRVASQTYNNGNRRKRKPQTSIFKGVSWSAPRQRWVARIAFRGRQIPLGRFTAEATAALVYDLKAVALFGEFALTNFPVPNSARWIHG